MIDIFKNDLLSLSDEQIINKHYLSGSAFALDHDLHYSLRDVVSQHFHVDFTEVFLVGSAKLGFSIKPRRRFQPFTDSSDIDVVIVSSVLFEKIWKEILAFENDGGYWPKIRDFKRYHYRGWIRPDKLPLEPSFVFTKFWWQFFEDISATNNFGPYKIRGGLYHSRFFLQMYQQICFAECREELTQ